VLYRDFTTQAEVDAEYNVAAAAHDLDGSMARTRALSEQALSRAGWRFDNAYGPTLAE
jgi:hypothetical protein